MIVVADASPLRYLILIGYAHVLPALYGRVVVPPAVVAELSQPRTPDVVRTWLTAAPEWLRLQAPIRERKDMRRGLGAGEREAIALPAELSADALLVDDRDARHQADKLGIPVLATLRVLTDAAEHGFGDLAMAFDRLRQTNFRASEHLLQRLLDRAVQERKK